MGEKGNDDPGLLAALQASSPELASKALEVYTRYQEARVAKAGADAIDTEGEATPSDPPPTAG